VCIILAAHLCKSVAKQQKLFWSEILPLLKNAMLFFPHERDFRGSSIVFFLFSYRSIVSDFRCWHPQPVRTDKVHQPVPFYSCENGVKRDSKHFSEKQHEHTSVTVHGGCRGKIWGPRKALGLFNGRSHTTTSRWISERVGWSMRSKISLQTITFLVEKAWQYLGWVVEQGSGMSVTSFCDFFHGKK